MGTVSHEKVHPEGGRPAPLPRRGWLFVAAAILVIVLIAAWALARSRTPDAVVAGATGGSAAANAPGEIRVRLADAGRFYTEGFQIDLRFETGEGEVIASTSWTGSLASSGPTDMDGYYDSVRSQPVPAGTIRIWGEVDLGVGPGPSITDPSGDLRCLLTVKVAPGEVVTVEASADDPADCLHLIPSGDPDLPTTAVTEPEMATGVATIPRPSATVATPGPGTAPATPGSLAVGQPYYVDVDLECEAFELSGVWVLAEGDTSTWQPPGERHEGGMFTLDRPDHGRFVGDANGVKTATFRLLPPDEPPACAPVPRSS